MYKKKPFFITFEGIEGSGKSFQSKKLYNNLKKYKINPILTREPGGTISAEKIRKIILSGDKNKFSKTTDTLLYLAARNEHVEKKIRPLINKRKIIICDRFIDSSIAYQVYGNGVKRKLIDSVHKIILGKIKPDLTILLTVEIKKAFSRLKLRKSMNRYDKFSKNFYIRVQKGFLKNAMINKKRYLILNNSTDNKLVESFILKKVLFSLKKWTKIIVILIY